jgi:hypothetical protein
MEIFLGIAKQQGNETLHFNLQPFAELRARFFFFGTFSRDPELS